MPPIASEGTQSVARNVFASSVLNTLLFAGHLLTAIAGPGQIAHFFTLDLTKRSLLFEDLRSAAIAFGLGLFVFYKFKQKAEPAKWIWLLGAFALFLRLLHVVNGPGGMLFPEFRRGDSPLSIRDFKEWTVFTLTLVRTGFYSLGAYLYSRRFAGQEAPNILH